LGHERVGHLPKSKKWNDLVSSISEFDSVNDNISEIANDAITNVSNRFLNIHKDSGFQSAFKFLLLLAYCNKSENPSKFLQEHGLNIDNNISSFQLAKIADSWVRSHEESKEYSAFSSKILISTINDWLNSNNLVQQDIFGTQQSILDNWKNGTSGAGFCEISRTFFSKFTTLYLNYFLERAASSKLNTFEEREMFSERMSLHIDDISLHAFEVSKIGQSFSAGWYNKHTKSDFPSNIKIKNFLSFMMKKFSDELKTNDVA